MIESIGQSEVLSERWASYAASNDYASGIAWAEASDALHTFCDLMTSSFSD